MRVFLPGLLLSRCPLLWAQPAASAPQAVGGRLLGRRRSDAHYSVVPGG